MANTEKIVPITMTIGEKTYTLEFNRNSVVSAERMGFDVENIKTAPMTTIPLLFFAAFKMHHPEIKRAETDRILFDILKGLKESEVKRLVELYIEPTSTLINSDEDERKNVTISL